jgi:hypothetical protein
MVDYPGNNFQIVVDEVWGKPLPSGHERTYHTPALMPGTVPEYLKVVAAIYEDGTTAGKAEDTAILLDDRRRKLRGLQAILPRLEKLHPGKTAPQIIADLRTWKDSLASELRFVADIVIYQLERVPVPELLEDLRGREQAVANSKPKLL